MNDAMIVEAVRAVGGPTAAEAAIGRGADPSAAAVPDPAAVERFQAAMAVNAPQAVGQAAEATAAIPFASEVAASWRSAQANNQGILHRIRALTELQGKHSLSAGELVELQYEVMNLSFQQEVVTKVADKSSNAIQTLIKNQ